LVPVWEIFIFRVVLFVKNIFCVIWLTKDSVGPLPNDQNDAEPVVVDRVDP
jgi:hypothetical protein